VGFGVALGEGARVFGVLAELLGAAVAA